MKQKKPKKRPGKPLLTTGAFGGIISPDDYLDATILNQKDDETTVNDADEVILLDDSIDIDIDDWTAIDEDVACKKAETVYKKHFEVMKEIDNDVSKNEWNLDDMAFSTSCSASQATSPNEKSSKDLTEGEEVEDSIPEFDGDPEILDMLKLSDRELKHKESLFKIIYPEFDEKKKVRDENRAARKRRQEEEETKSRQSQRKRKRRMYSKTA